jgi:hypothetical protein
VDNCRRSVLHLLGNNVRWVSKLRVGTEKQMDTRFKGAAVDVAIDLADPMVVSGWRWYFAELPGPMKNVAAGLLSRVLLGADPNQMLPGERQILSLCRVNIPQYWPRRPVEVAESVMFEA